MKQLVFDFFKVGKIDTAGLPAETVKELEKINDRFDVLASVPSNRNKLTVAQAENPFALYRLTFVYESPIAPPISVKMSPDYVSRMAYYNALGDFLEFWRKQEYGLKRFRLNNFAGVLKVLELLSSSSDFKVDFYLKKWDSDFLFNALIASGEKPVEVKRKKGVRDAEELCGG